MASKCAASDRGCRIRPDIVALQKFQNLGTFRTFRLADRGASARNSYCSAFLFLLVSNALELVQDFLCTTLRAVRNERNVPLAPCSLREPRVSRLRVGGLPSPEPICIVNVRPNLHRGERESGNESESVSGTVTAVPAAKSCRQPSRALTTQTVCARTSVFACAKNANGSDNSSKLGCDGTSVPIADTGSVSLNPSVELHNMLYANAPDLGLIPLSNGLL